MDSFIEMYQALEQYKYHREQWKKEYDECKPQLDDEKAIATKKLNFIAKYGIKSIDGYRKRFKNIPFSFKFDGHEFKTQDEINTYITNLNKSYSESVAAFEDYFENKEQREIYPFIDKIDALREHHPQLERNDHLEELWNYYKEHEYNDEDEEEDEDIDIVMEDSNSEEKKNNKKTIETVPFSSQTIDVALKRNIALAEWEKLNKKQKRKLGKRKLQENVFGHKIASFPTKYKRALFFIADDKANGLREKIPLASKNMNCKDYIGQRVNAAGKQLSFFNNKAIPANIKIDMISWVDTNFQKELKAFKKNVRDDNF